MVNWGEGTVVQAKSTVFFVSAHNPKKPSKPDIFRGVVVEATATTLTIEYWSIRRSRSHFTVTVPRDTACEPNQTRWTSIDSDKNRATYHPILQKKLNVPQQKVQG